MSYTTEEDLYGVVQTNIITYANDLGLNLQRASGIF